MFFTLYLSFPSTYPSMTVITAVPEFVYRYGKYFQLPIPIRRFLPRTAEVERTWKFTTNTRRDRKFTTNTRNPNPRIHHWASFFPPSWFSIGDPPPSFEKQATATTTHLRTPHVPGNTFLFFSFREVLYGKSRTQRWEDGNVQCILQLELEC
jgi:hypothetical protein